MRSKGTTDLIRAALAEAGSPLTIDDICILLPEATERRSVTALVQQRKAAGEFSVAIVDGRAAYSLAPGFDPESSAPAPRRRRTPAPQNGGSEEPTSPRKKLSRDFAAAAKSGGLRAALEFNHATACDALDVYVASVVDPKIYGPLVAARDASRQALDAHIGGAD